jgi:hypothetical protein
VHKKEWPIRRMGERENDREKTRVITGELECKRKSETGKGVYLREKKREKGTVCFKEIEREKVQKKELERERCACERKRQ